MADGNHGNDPTGPYPRGSWPPAPYGPGPAGPPPPPLPGAETNSWATWSIVMAFLFPPAGAVFGHWALADSRYRRGRNRAVIGLVLSYTFIIVAVGALVVWAVLPTYPAASTTSASPTTATPAPTSTPAPTRTPAPKPPTLGAADLPRVLLSLDEVKAITQLPNMESFDPTGAAGPGGGNEGQAPPPVATPECVSAVLNGIDTVYANSGATGYTAFHFRDRPTSTLVDQAVTTFGSAAAAQRFVAKVSAQWRQCSGRDVTISAPGLPSLTASIGSVVATADRVTLQNTLNAKRPLAQSRIMAAKANVVFDLNAFSTQLTPDQPEAIATQVLARIPG
jgi:hypothetical protein